MNDFASNLQRTMDPRHTCSNLTNSCQVCHAKNYYGSNDFPVYYGINGSRDSQENSLRAMVSTSRTDFIGCKVIVYPRGADAACDGFMSVHLRVEALPSDAPKLYVHCEFYVYCMNDFKHSKSSFFIADENNRTTGFAKFINHDKIFATNSYRQHQNIRLYCHIRAYPVPTPDPLAPRDNHSQKSSLARDFEALLRNENLADVTLVVERAGGDDNDSKQEKLNGNKLKAHKAILSARSPVFAKMFEHNMKERRDNIVHVRDLDLETLHEMLHYLYTGKLMTKGSTKGDVTKQQHRAYKLLAAADKYMLEDLKDDLADHVIRRLTTVSNVFEHLELADKYGMAELKKDLIDFVNWRASEIVGTPGFEALNKSQPHLVAEIYSQLVRATPPAALAHRWPALSTRRTNTRVAVKGVRGRRTTVKTKSTAIKKPKIIRRRRTRRRISSD